IEAKGQQVVLCWQPDDNPNITGYTITRWDEGGQMTQYQISETNASRFVDTNVSPNTAYTYQVAVCSTDGTLLKGSQLMVRVQPLPGETGVLACYPNPSTGEVWIPYRLAAASDVKITIYNVAGELIRTLELGEQSAEEHIGNDAAKWDGRTQSGEQVASGIYIYLFRAGGYTSAGKVGMVR
ncbi:MAG: FlgD immunoglobulin-like domain containing protein, partial [Candidatus Desantisbacteria bacterium]